MCAFVERHGAVGLRPYGSSFLVFTDYCRGALRLSALMELPVIFIWTHDSISLGEDGPTHQPVEHLAVAARHAGHDRAPPGRCERGGRSLAGHHGIKHRPVCLVLSRQALPTFDRTRYAPAAGLARGAYVLADAPTGKPDVLLLATGSEVSLCLTAREQLKAEGIGARVVSMPSWEIFEEQPEEYRDSGCCPPEIDARVVSSRRRPPSAGHATPA